MFEKKIVSVIIPTYKRSEFLLKTIDSVLKQSYEPIEIIVVDDNGIGTDFQKATQEMLQSLIDNGDIIYIPHEKNKNGSAARNTGFKVSKGEYINFLDDDDELMPDKIEKQVEILELCGLDYGATYCNTTSKRIQNISRKLIVKSSQYLQEGDILEDYLLTRCCFGTSSILFRREIIEALNGFDESYIRHQDLELMTRFFTMFKIKATGEEPLIVYDMTKDRGNVVAPIKDFDIKKKYLSQFKSLFEERNILYPVCHHFWYNCATNALVCFDYKVYRKAYIEMKKYGHNNRKEITIMFKRFITGILRKIGL